MGLTFDVSLDISSAAEAYMILLMNKRKINYFDPLVKEALIAYIKSEAQKEFKDRNVIKEIEEDEKSEFPPKKKKVAKK